MTFIHDGDALSVAAAKTGMDDKTARKYRKLGKLPSQLKSTRHWRTRTDVFKAVWGEIEQLLLNEPALEAITIFDYLCRQYEGQFQAGHLHTLQRRIKAWRTQHGPPKEVFFPQQHTPGLMGQSDFTHMSKLQITIAGEFFAHLFYHFTLTYSNWETGSICYSESFESLSGGLQNALWELGAVPFEHRTDSLSAAVNNLSDLEEFTQNYQGLLAYYHLRASHNNPGRGHENGDVEQSHHRFKQAVDQELLLRGSRDFTSLKDYEAFLTKMLKRRNQSRQERLQEERAHLQALPPMRLQDYSRLPVRVSRNATIRVKGNLYSVSSQLIGELVEVRLFSAKLEIYYADQRLEEIRRLRGTGKHAINYRHIIHSLVRKPGAFAHYRYQSDLLPRLLFRVAYDCLRENYPATAERQYLKILELAATVSEQRVEEGLRQMIKQGQRISEERVRQYLQSATPQALPYCVEIAPVQLQHYDLLLESQEVR
ncbi:MAG: IS21 family transposase [Acidobacteria bacterium]|nr:IS21 family transposase [Acidobacteriota bacterium]